MLRYKTPPSPATRAVAMTGKGATFPASLAAFAAGTSLCLGGTR